MADHIVEFMGQQISYPPGEHEALKKLRRLLKGGLG